MMKGGLEYEQLLRRKFITSFASSISREMLLPRPLRYQQRSPIFYLLAQQLTIVR